MSQCLKLIVCSQVQVWLKVSQTFICINTLTILFWLFFLLTPPMEMEQTECSKMSARKIQTLGNHPEQKIHHSEQPKFDIKNHYSYLYVHVYILNRETKVLGLLQDIILIKSLRSAWCILLRCVPWGIFLSVACEGTALTDDCRGSVSVCCATCCIRIINFTAGKHCCVCSKNSPLKQAVSKSVMCHVTGHVLRRKQTEHPSVEQCSSKYL